MTSRLLFLTCMPLSEPKSASMAFMGLVLQAFPGRFAWFSLRGGAKSEWETSGLPYAGAKIAAGPARPTAFRLVWRYIRGEGESRYSSGKRFSVARFVRVTFHAFFDNFTKHNCLADGIDGVFLTLFYTWYVGMSELSLLRYQLREKCFCKVNKLKRFMSNGLPKD